MHFTKGVKSISIAMFLCQKKESTISINYGNVVSRKKIICCVYYLRMGNRQSLFMVAIIFIELKYLELLSLGFTISYKLTNS